MGLLDWLFGRPAPKKSLKKPTGSRSPTTVTAKPLVIFPTRRLSGPVEGRATTPYLDLETGQQDMDWTTICVPDAYLHLRRPGGAIAVPWGQLIEVTPTGKHAQNFAERAYYDLVSDISDAGQVGEDDDDQSFSQDFILRRSGDKIAILRRFYDGKSETIGYLPENEVANLNVEKLTPSKVYVEVVELRMMDADEKPIVRYSVSLFDVPMAGKA